MRDQTRDLMNDWLIAYPPKTAVEYRRDFEDYADWLGEEDPLQADRARIQRHLAHLTDQGMAPSSVRRHASAISSFYRYAFQEKLIEHNPAVHVRRPKGEADPKRGLTTEQAHQLIAAAREHSRAAHALVWLMAGVGLRLAEACSLDVDDITEETLTVTVKGGHRQTKPLVGPTRAAVLEAIGTRTEGSVLRNSDGNRLARRPAWKLVTDLADQCGIEGCTPHTLRHTAATLALEAGAPLQDVSALLGHRSLETTLRYIEGRDIQGGTRSAAQRLAQVLAAPELADV